MKMNLIHFYHKDTGIIFPGNFSWDSAEDPAQVIALNTPADHLHTFEPVTDHQSQRIDIVTGKLTAYIPLAPSEDHEWNEPSKRWQLKRDVLNNNEQRAGALMHIEALEKKQPRLIREAVLGDANAFSKLKDLDDQIKELRKVL